MSKYYDNYPRCIVLTVQKWVINGYFRSTQKTRLFIFTRYQSSKIDIILRQDLDLVRVLLYLCACKFSGWRNLHVKL